MDNTEYLTQLAEQEKKNKQIELEQTKAAALQSIEQQRSTTMPKFTAQKQQASVQSQLGAKNLAEFWANRGQTQQGISQQAELSRQNTLGSTLQGIGANEAQAEQGFANQIGATETNIQNQLTNFNNQVDTELSSNLYKDQLAQQEAMAKAQQQDFENQLAIAKFNLSASKSSGTSAVSKTPLTKVGNYSNTIIPYTTDKNKPIIGAVVDGKNVIYNLANGSTVKFALGTNPYTGTKNPDAVNASGNLTTFSNGYQPDNVNQVKLKNTGAIVNNNGENVKIWTTSTTTSEKGKGLFGKTTTKTTNNYYYWDSASNKYKTVPTNILKSAGLK